jgi:hypothetical protein
MRQKANYSDNEPWDIFIAPKPTATPSRGRRTTIPKPRREDYESDGIYQRELGWWTSVARFIATWG